MGANSKWAAVRKWIRNKSPAILILQETKFQVSGNNYLEGYIVYELVSDGGENIEALTVDINIKR